MQGREERNAAHSRPNHYVAQRAMVKRISGSGGSSGALAGRITLMTEPAFDGVSVTKYELFESEPTAISVALPTRAPRATGGFAGSSRYSRAHAARIRKSWAATGRVRKVRWTNRKQLASQSERQRE